MMAVKVLRWLLRKSTVNDTGKPSVGDVRATPFRRGSGTKSISTAMTTPGSPTATKVACQGRSSPRNGSTAGDSVKRPSSKPPARRPTPAPTGAPVPKTPMARPRLSGEKRSASSDTAPGISTASPTATQVRAATRCTKSVARPLAAVATLQTAIPTAMITGRSPRSIMRAIGSPMTA